jgi:hypothetical protein
MGPISINRCLHIIVLNRLGGASSPLEGQRMGSHSVSARDRVAEQTEGAGSLTA